MNTKKCINCGKSKRLNILGKIKAGVDFYKRNLFWCYLATITVVGWVILALTGMLP